MTLVDRLVSIGDARARELVKRLRDARPSHSAECDRRMFNAPCACGFRETRAVCKDAADFLAALLDAPGPAPRKEER